MVLRKAMILVAGGIVIGIPAGLAASRLIASQLFGLKANDPWTMATAIFVMVCVASLSSYLPARRAARVNPIVALRYE